MDQEKFDLIQQKVWENNRKKNFKVENAMAVAGLKAALTAGEKYICYTNLKRILSYFRPVLDPDKNKKKKQQRIQGPP
jgi:hypothetical protein